ncbi:DUF4440 domain-containing protein [Maribacter litopenaei]|uniref:DUF4440 domain-containing protein n=1 Tax=Maribacter litopenaei TaxID=2976127 RepID=A0ABY5YD82_9FLAO|nr:DUF4440 domain-containing protein [Maribacter litopenaei]UWX56282.1 DUF4440 domain-containing protein [Maribacter litopenaei]
MRYLFLALIMLLGLSCTNHRNDLEDINQIKKILSDQQQSWTKGGIEGFMSGYLKSDSLKFYSGAKLSKGWQNTLDNYQIRYPTKSHTGTLNFKIADISKINDDAYWVMGEYYLKREVGDATGTFLIIFKRIDGEWKIVADSSC